MKTNYQILYIKWRDATSTASSDWKPVEVYLDLEPMIIHSVGFLIEETEGSVTLLSHLSDDDSNGCGDICILKANIIEQAVLVEEMDGDG